MQLIVMEGLPADHEAAIQVWRAANIARQRPPSAARVARIWEKLADPDACLVIGRVDTRGEMLAMALAEPGRAEDGDGAVVPGSGHVSMLFVHPDFWGQGVGSQLLQGLHDRASERGWSSLKLWTRGSNLRARRLYEGQGYRASGRETSLEAGDLIIELARPAH